MAISVGAFSTDFTQEPVIDEEKSRLTGKTEFLPNKKRLSFGGTFWYRGAMPLMELNKHGYNNHLSWRFQIAPDGHIQTLDVNGEWHDPDIVYQQRWMHRDGAEQFKKARATGQKIVGDLDDHFWQLSKTNIAYHTTDPKKNPDFNRDHYWNNLGACDAITVSTDLLRHAVERLNVPTFVLRNAINLVDWPQNDPGGDSAISWIGGLQWRSHDLEQLRCAGLPQFLESNNLPMYHGGDSQVPGVDKFYTRIGINPLKTQCMVAPLCPIWEYPRLWAPVGVSLIPLEQCAFNHAKSWLKALESCAAGVPYIVSAKFPEQELLIDEGTAGREARNDKPRQWIDHLYDLLDPEIRREEGMINRSIAEKHDVQDRWIDWDAVYGQL